MITGTKTYKTIHCKSDIHHGIAQRLPSTYAILG